jgi:hypothetical protein
MIETARTRHDRLLGCKPWVSADSPGDRFAALDLRILHVNRADTELLVAQQSLLMWRHVVLDQIRRAIDVADKVRLVATGIEVTVANLRVVFLADRIVALADAHRDVDIIGNVLDLKIDRVDRRPYLVFIGHCEERFIDLNVLAACRNQLFEVIMEQLAEIGHH